MSDAELIQRYRRLYPKDTAFTRGAALGSPGFISATLQHYQKLTGRRVRQKQHRPMHGADWHELATLRGLRRTVFG